MSIKNRFIRISLLIFIGCSMFILPERIYGLLRTNRVERFFDKGLESKYKSFRLETITVIDTEAKNLLDKGLYDIQDFEVDSKGNIYILNASGKGDFIYKFDQRGNFRLSFGRQGEGPGEIASASQLVIYKDDKIFVQDSKRRKIVVFGSHGQLLEEKKLPADIKNIYPLENGHFVGLELRIGATEEKFQHFLNYYNSEFKKERQLDTLSYPNPFRADNIKAYFYNLIFYVEGDKIYSGYPERGYEILVFDLKGNLLKKIKKERKKIPMTKEYRELFLKYIEPIRSLIEKKLEFPQYLPPFYSFFVDEQGYLFLMTLESGEKEGEFFYDILNPEGDLIGRKSLGIYFDGGKVLAKFYKDIFCFVQEKESGFKQLVVSKIYLRREI